MDRGTCQLRVRRWLAQYLVPHAELGVPVVNEAGAPIEARHREQHRVGHMLPRRLQRLDRLCLTPLHSCRARQELEVVDEVHRVIIGRRRLLNVGEVSRRAFPIGLGRFLISPHPLHDVGWHMFEMPGGRHHAGQNFRGRERLFWMGRGLNRMDVIVIGAGVLGIALQHDAERIEDLLRARVLGSVGIPQLPRIGVHQSLGVHGLHVEIVRILLRDEAHRLDVILEQRRAVRRIHLFGSGIRFATASISARSTGVTRFAFACALCSASVPTRAREELIIGML